jgi:hypothetical protein
MPIYISPAVLAKLAGKQPPVCREEVEQCFVNRESPAIEDTREQHKTDPATLWFIAETDARRELKVVFLQRDSGIYIRSAYDPNDDEKAFYAKHTV